MSSIAVDLPNSPTVVARGRALFDDNNGNRSSRATNHRSLSARIRSLFRKDSSSPNRSTSKDRRQRTTSARQSSSSPEATRSTTEAARLRTPIVKWPFSRKKTKLSSTTSATPTNKTKIKSSRKAPETTTLPIDISNSIYDQENRSAIHGQHFVPRTPELAHDSNQRFQPTSNFEVVVPDANFFKPSSFQSTYSPSTSTNRQNLTNTNIEYHYQNTHSMPSVSIPFADVEVIHTPRGKRKVGDSPSMPKTQILIEKPPIVPSTILRPPVNVSTSTSQLNGTSSSALNKNGIYPTRSSSENRDVPKLTTPSIVLDGKSNKKKAKLTKSQLRADAMSTSTSTISNLVKANPLQPNQFWTKTYGSLPDAELFYDKSRTSSKPYSVKNDKYPGLSNILWHHLRPTSILYDERTPKMPATPHGLPRFETSTATSTEYEQHGTRFRQPLKDSATSTAVQQHDGYIRPMSPKQSSSQADVSVIRINISDLRDPPSTRTSRRTHYDSPEPSVIYRSTTTIYTRDKNNQLGSGEIRTWSSQERGFGNEYYETHRKQPHTLAEIECATDQRNDKYDNQIVPPKKKAIQEEFRYSPRAHEQEYIEKEKHTIDDSDQSIHEEKYEISYVYEGQNQKYAYETRNYYEQQPDNQFLNDMGGIRNMITPDSTPAIESSIINEREKYHDYSPCSYTYNEYTQEPLLKGSPIGHFQATPCVCTLKRTDSYDGLGILVASDTRTRLNHFIREVESGSPGDRGGLRKNDRIISVNGINVENIDFNDVLILIKQGLDEDNLQLSVIHEPEHI